MGAVGPEEVKLVTPPSSLRPTVENVTRHLRYEEYGQSILPPPPATAAAPAPLSVASVNKLNSEIGMVAVVRAIASSMGLPKPSVVDVPARAVENAAA